MDQVDGLGAFVELERVVDDEVDVAGSKPNGTPLCSRGMSQPPAAPKPMRELTTYRSHRTRVSRFRAGSMTVWGRWCRSAAARQARGRPR